MSEYIITKEQIEELNRAHGGMKIVTSWLSCYAIWDTSNIYPVMKSEHVAVDLPEIVRCRDCYYADEFEGGYWCDRFGGGREHVSPSGFCAWGARADEQRDGNGTCPDGNETCPNHPMGARREP